MTQTPGEASELRLDTLSDVYTEAIRARAARTRLEDNRQNMLRTSRHADDEIDSDALHCILKRNIASLHATTQFTDAC